MNIIKHITQIFLISIFLSSCSSSINKESPLNNFEENINIKTKRLAKKQITWFKKEPKLNMIETDNQDLVYNSMMEIING